jgi:hypothetical protein
MIASPSDGGVAYVLVPPLFTRRERRTEGFDTADLQEAKVLLEALP